MLKSRIFKDVSLGSRFVNSTLIPLPSFGHIEKQISPKKSITVDKVWIEINTKEPLLRFSKHVNVSRKCIDDKNPQYVACKSCCYQWWTSWRNNTCNEQDCNIPKCSIPNYPLYKPSCFNYNLQNSVLMTFVMADI